VNALETGVLALDCAAEEARLTARLRAMLRDLGRRGFVVGLSGGVDSAVSAALAARAVGAPRVLGLLLPEADAPAESVDRARQVAGAIGIRTVLQDITPALEAIGCYRARDEAIRRLEPGYGEGWRSKIAIRGGIEGRYNVFDLIVQDPDGRLRTHRLDAETLMAIVAATGFKQRIRKSIEYFHADRLNYAVVGTPNRVEYDQGFFVKQGDGAADVKPIAHLYKTQVCELAGWLGLPDDVRGGEPTTGTYSLAQTQEEFFFGLPFRQLDYALWALNHGVPASDLARFLGMDEPQAARIYRDIRQKRLGTRYLHAAPVLAAPVPEVPVS
jgi:NAD+ synthase